MAQESRNTAPYGFVVGGFIGWTNLNKQNFSFNHIQVLAGAKVVTYAPDTRDRVVLLRMQGSRYCRLRSSLSYSRFLEFGNG